MYHFYLSLCPSEQDIALVGGKIYYTYAILARITTTKLDKSSRTKTSEKSHCSD